MAFIRLIKWADELIPIFFVRDQNNILWRNFIIRVKLLEKYIEIEFESFEYSFK